MYYLGIDWANDKHDLCLLDTRGKIVREYARSRAIFERFMWAVPSSDDYCKVHKIDLGILTDFQ
jgi:hypothetical protein